MEADGMSIRERLLLLEECYDELVKTINDEEADPKRITDLVGEAEEIMGSLSHILEYSEFGEQTEIEILEAIKAKADALVNLLRGEMDNIIALSKKLTTGRQAIGAYDSPLIGLGYTEGKFVDRKK